MCIMQYTVFLPLLHNNGHHRWVGIPLGSNTWIEIRFYYSSIPNSLFHFQKVVYHINIIDGTLHRTMRAWSVKDAYSESQWFTGQTVTGVGYWFLSDLGCEKGDSVCMCEWENKGEREEWESVKEREMERERREGWEQDVWSQGLMSFIWWLVVNRRVWEGMRDHCFSNTHFTMACPLETPFSCL